MKFLLDENITFRLVKALLPDYPGSCHVKDVSLLEADDNLIWKWAQRNGFTILTQDADFEQLSLLRGHPPKVIYLRLGNCSLLNLITQLRAHQQLISRFFLDANAACLELSRSPLTSFPAE